MKKGLLNIGLVLVLLSCSGESKDESGSPSNDDTLNVVQPVTVNNENVSVKDLSIFDQTVEAYIKCKSESKKKYDCKEYTAKSICEAYGINDFKEGDNYIDYDKIPKKIQELNNWEKIGEVTESNIEIALQKLNDLGKVVVVFDTKHAYSPISILKENGKLSISGKWGGLKIPSAISFHSTKPARSSANKGLNLVYSSKDNLEIWYRKSN